MEESLAEQSSSSLETTPPLNFWHTFRLFPSSFDESGFKYWYIYIYGLLALALIPLLAYYFHVIVPSSEYKLYTDNILLYILLPITLSLVVLSFNHWRRGIRGVFEDFDSSASGRHLSSRRGESHFNEDYTSFLNAYQDRLLSSYRYIVICIAVITSVALLSFMLKAYVASPFSLLLFCILPGGIILGYFLGVSGWAMLVTGHYLRTVTTRFDLHIEPGHPDNCGGLRPLGRFCFSMALPILVGAVFFAIYGIGGTLYPALLPNVSDAIRLGAGAGLLVFDVPLAALAFFFPLWGIHREMVRQKELYEERFAASLAKMRQRLWSSIDTDAFDEARTIRRQINILQLLDPDTLAYPTWPFSRRLLALYLVPQLLPLVSLLLPLFMRH
jgi:hypothetical protein